MKKLIIVIFGLVFAGCGGGSGSSSGKSLFSLWSDGLKTLNLSGGGLTVPYAMYWVFLNGAVCQSQITLIGTEASGSYTIANSIYQSGGSGDPGCAAFDSSGTYTNSGATLMVCRTSPFSCSSWN